MRSSGHSIPGLVRDMLLSEGVKCVTLGKYPTYDVALKFSQKLSERLMEADWLELYDGTTFIRSRQPKSMGDALKVIALTPHIRKYLKENDPKALAQVREALGLEQ
jgi:hypothetical protein